MIRLKERPHNHYIHVRAPSAPHISTPTSTSSPSGSTAGAHGTAGCCSTAWPSRLCRSPLCRTRPWSKTSGEALGETTRCRGHLSQLDNQLSRIWRFDFPKVLGKMDFGADRLPAPPPLPLYEECFHCTSIVQGSVRHSAGRRAGPHARESTGTSCAAVRLSCASVRPPRVRVAGRRSIVVR